MWYPVYKEEKLEVILFVFFSHSIVAFWGFRICEKSFTSRVVEFVWLGACDGVGSCRVGELGRDSWFGPLTFPNPSRPFPPNPPFVQPPPILPTLWPPPPSHLLLSQTLAATHLTLAVPPISSSKVPFLAARIYVAWCKSSIVSGGGKEEGKGENPRWFLCLSLVHLCCNPID
jgi:hypothetical protein